MKLVSVIVVLVMVLLCVGCTGENGGPGAVYLRYSWGSNITQYWDDVPMPLSTSYYQVAAGTYSFDYTSTTYRVWGTFTLVAYDGEKGGPFWKKGKDGDSRYYTVHIGASSLYLSKPSNLLKSITGSPVAFDPLLPIRMRADTTEGTIVLWRYQEQELNK